MNSAHEKLNTEFGLALIAPPYDGGDDRVCGTATYVPGAKENGGIFCHANTWSMWRRRCWFGRPGVPLLPPDPATRPNGLRQIQDRAVCLPAEHLRPDASIVRHGPQRLADRDRCLDVIRGPRRSGFWASGPRSRVCEWPRPYPPIGPVSPPAASSRGTVYEIAVGRDGPGNAVAMVVDGVAIDGDVAPLPRPGMAVVRVEVVLR